MQGVAIAPALPGVNFVYHVANVIGVLILFAYLAAGFYRRDVIKSKL